MPAVAFYISGHGFGHASRQIEIINALGRLRPDIRIVIRTSAARWLFDRTATPPLTFLPGACDTGVVQIDSLRLNERATIETAAAFAAVAPALAHTEAGILRQHGIDLVIADAPPLACEAAARAGIPAIVVANFTWDWIYAAYADDLRRAPELLPSIHAAYAKAEAAWRLPMHGGFDAFRSIVDVPFVARHATHARDDTRRRLGLPLDRRLALASFGGVGLTTLDYERIDAGEDWQIVHTGTSGLGESAIYDCGLRYEDLVAAVDVVVTKPGYGIIAECLANGPAILYTSRGRFPEYDVLVDAMPRLLRCAFIEQTDLLAGRWRDGLLRAINAPAPAATPPTDGAEVIAGMIAARL